MKATEFINETEETIQYYNLMQWRKDAKKHKMRISVGQMAGTKGVKIYDADTLDGNGVGRFFSGSGWNYGHITIPRKNIKEITQITKSDYTPTRISANSWKQIQPELVKNAKIIKHGYAISTTNKSQSGPAKIVYAIDTENFNLAAYTEYLIIKDKNNFKSTRITNSYVYPNHRGKNLAVDLYKWIIKHHSQPIQSDELQTVNGQKLWVKLYMNSKLDVVGYVDVTVPFSKKYKDEEVEKILNKLRNIGATYYAKSGNKIRYLLPVEPAGSGRRLKFKDEIGSLKLYNSWARYQEYGETFIPFVTGLLAFAK